MWRIELGKDRASSGSASEIFRNAGEVQISGRFSILRLYGRILAGSSDSSNKRAGILISHS